MVQRLPLSLKPDRTTSALSARKTARKRCSGTSPLLSEMVRKYPSTFTGRSASAKNPLQQQEYSLPPAVGNLRFCAFGQTMVQSPRSAFWRVLDLKGLQTFSGQTMVQKRPNDRSSHKLALSLDFLEEPKPVGSRLSGKAEARRAASAQGWSPARGARERKGRLKRRVTGNTKADPRGSAGSPSQGVPFAVELRNFAFGFVCWGHCKPGGRRKPK